MKPASGVHRKSMGPAISRGLPTRPSGMAAAIWGPSFGSPSVEADISVATHPGATQLTRMPSAPARWTGFGETDERAFGYGIVGVVGLAALAGGGTDEHDVAAGLTRPGGP